MTHLLLLALSTLPKSGDEPFRRTSDIPISSFYPDGEGKNADEEIIYIGQMEPILIWKAKKHPKDEIRTIVLCTKQVMCEEFSAEDPVTDAQFFMKSVCEQLDTEIDLSGYDKNRFEQQAFSSNDKRLQFLLVPIDEKKVTPGIAASVDLIRTWKHSPEAADARFWIDAHGAFRSTMTILTGMVSLLKIDGIVPDNIFSSRYTKKTMYLEDGRDAFEFFDFVSGMNDFVNYGNADMLRNYFGKRDVSQKEKDMLAAIDKIAMGTQCCDTINYKQGLTELANLMKEEDESSSSLLGVFFDYIRDSYGDLLTKNRTTLMIVKRCVEKKLYQQALTFIESSMPEEIVKKGLLTFALWNYQLEEVVNFKDGSPKYYLFDSYLKMGNLFPTKARGDSLKKAVKEYVQHADGLRNLLQGGTVPSMNIDTYVNTENKNNILPFDKNKRPLAYGVPDVIKGIDSDVPVKDLDALGIFLRMHLLLKRCRNVFNHSVTDRPELEDILALVNLYIEYAEYLYSR